MSQFSDSIERRALLAGAGVLGVAAISKLARGGPINPPTGAVASTGKTLVEVEPRIAIMQQFVLGVPQAVTITVPGSYYLAGSVVAAGGVGITISVGNVVLDLNGFTVTGGGGGGIVVAGGNVVVQNGFVGGGGGGPGGVAAINAPGAVGLGVRNVGLNGGAGPGIVAGANAQIMGVRVNAFGGNGIMVGANALLVDVTSTGNAGSGVVAGGCAILDRVIASGNTLNGIATGMGSVVENSLTCMNGMNGFVLASSSNFSFCSAMSNTLAGFTTAMPLDAACTLTSCSAQTNGGVGFATGSGFLLSGCHANLNISHGFVVVTQCRLFNCHADRNSLVGGVLGSAAGFNLTGGQNHIEQCSASENGFGFLMAVAGTPSVIVRNFASANGSPGPSTDYVIASPGGLLGPVVTSVTGVTNPMCNVSA